MKKSLLVISLLFIQLSVTGQAIQNGDFENWSNFNYDETVSWITSNRESVPAFSIPTVTPVGGFSGLAARIETYIIGTDTLGGYVINSTDNPIDGIGGIPYSQQPTDITGYYRYELPGIDTAILIVTFKSGGSIISTDIFAIKGTGSELTYVPFTFPLSLGSVPDTVIIAMAASNLISGIGIEANSWIEFDELAFSGPSITQPIPNGTFDNWINKSIDNPFGWINSGDGVKQSTDAVSGLYALSLETTDQGFGPEIAAVSSGQDFSMGGQPFTNMGDTLVGFYKFLTSAPDTAIANINTMAGGSIVGGAYYQFISTSVYTPFAIPIGSSMTPDSIRIEFYSSYFPFDSAVVGSKLFIDQLDLQSIITGLNKEIDKNSKFFTSYPNPVSDVLHITYTGDANELETIIYNSIGEVVHHSSAESKLFDLSVRQLPAGCYWLKLVSGTSVSVRKIIKQ
ncbi:MAG TPA: T9SS type A sorting domain-containing protein [Bacteroidia bacterium]|nr:T9SS type A sorting domain-containing protein [Bacteroidia bacterium]